MSKTDMRVKVAKLQILVDDYPLGVVTLDMTDQNEAKLLFGSRDAEHVEMMRDTLSAFTDAWAKVKENDTPAEITRHGAN